MARSADPIAVSARDELGHGECGVTLAVVGQPPVVSHLGLTGRYGALDLYVNGSARALGKQVRLATTSTILSYDSSGHLRRVRRQHRGTTSIQIPRGGFAVVQS